jgi:hypothetical protein
VVASRARRQCRRRLVLDADISFELLSAGVIDYYVGVINC